MNAIHRLFSLLLCATTAMLWLLANAYAQSKDTKACAMLTGSFSPHGPVQNSAADPLGQMIQRKIHAACLQTRGKQGASRMTTLRTGTNTTNAGTFVTFDVPGANFTLPEAINNSGAIAGVYQDAGGLGRSFLRTSDGTITPFDPPGAVCNPSIFPGICNLSEGINPAGTIAGIWRLL